jgi:Ulp1 family protease
MPCPYQDVDIFSKDFLFIPVHDALHWSLLVVCYPGELGAAIETSSGGGGGSTRRASAATPGGDEEATGSGEREGPEERKQADACAPAQQQQREGSRAAADPGPILERRPCLLHLDSMPGGL